MLDKYFISKLSQILAQAEKGSMKYVCAHGDINYPQTVKYSNLVS